MSFGEQSLITLSHYQANHGETAHQCIALATSLLTNLYKPSLENLDRVISLFRQVLNKRTIAQPLYWETVHDLVSALTLKFMYANAKEDLEESLALRRKIREKEMYIAIANSDNVSIFSIMHHRLEITGYNRQRSLQEDKKKINPQKLWKWQREQKE